MNAIDVAGSRPAPGTLFYFLSSSAAGRMHGSPDAAAPALVRAQATPDVVTVSPLAKLLSRFADRYFDSLDTPAQFDGRSLEGWVLSEVRALPSTS